MGMQALANVLGRRNFVILDTETTGLEKPAEICQIAIIGPSAEILLYEYVNPTHSIPPAATRIHGITDETVQYAKSWPEVRKAVLSIIRDKDVIVYNATYDRKLMHWSDELSDDSHVDYKAFSQWHCAMEAYAEFYGEITPYYGSYKWQSLTNALIQQGLVATDAHDALVDCQSTLRLLHECTKGL